MAEQPPRFAKSYNDLLQELIDFLKSSDDIKNLGPGDFFAPFNATHDPEDIKNKLSRKEVFDIFNNLIIPTDKDGVSLGVLSSIVYQGEVLQQLARYYATLTVNNARQQLAGNNKDRAMSLDEGEIIRILKIHLEDLMKK